MKKLLLFKFLICIYSFGISQEIELNSEKLFKELAESACLCIDSLETFDKQKEEVVSEINKCVDEATLAFQLGLKLMNINELDDEGGSTGNKEVNININIDESSEEYKKNYYKIERYLMDSCASLQEKIASYDKLNDKSFSENELALDYYYKGLDEIKKENYEEAIKYFQDAISEDPEFAFAWDNLGLSYRRLNKFDEAIEAYEKSLEIDPNGKMPLQNIAVAYQHKEEYKKAIKAYKKLAKIDKDNAEVFYGIGIVYAINLKKYEKGLDYMCKAYNRYIEQKSPYRSDAEKVINHIYSKMKEQGDEEKFNRILENNDISAN